MSCEEEQSGERSCSGEDLEHELEVGAEEDFVDADEGGDEIEPNLEEDGLEKCETSDDLENLLFEQQPPPPFLQNPSTLIYSFSSVDANIAAHLFENQVLAIRAIKRAIGSLPLRHSVEDDECTSNDVAGKSQQSGKEPTKREDSGTGQTNKGKNIVASPIIVLNKLYTLAKNCLFLEEITIDEVIWLSDSVITRYLNSYHWSVAQATKHLQRTLRWRRMKMPQCINPTDVEEQLSTGKLYRKGFDKRGNAVLYFRPCRETCNSSNEIVDSLLYTMERAIKCGLPKRPCLVRTGASESDYIEGLYPQLTFVLDFNGWQLSQTPPLETPAEIAHVLSEHYTDILYEGYVVDAPSFFSGIWQIVKLAVHTDTAKKVHMLYTSKPEDVKFLQSRIPPNVLERCGQINSISPVEKHLLGEAQTGTWYDHKKYWQNEELHFMYDRMHSERLRSLVASHPQISPKLNK